MNLVTMSFLGRVPHIAKTSGKLMQVTLNSLMATHPSHGAQSVIIGSNGAIELTYELWAIALFDKC
jgi:hypothetical protein